MTFCISAALGFRATAIWKKGQSTGPFMEIKVCVERILLDLHISKKSLPCYIPGLQLIQFTEVFKTEILESKMWQKSSWISTGWWFLIPKPSQWIFLWSSCTITAPYTDPCGTAHPQTWEGCLESEPCYVQRILHSEQQIRGKIPFREMKLKMYFQFSLLRYIMHLFLLLH